MYKDRVSKGEMGTVDRKRINDALDKHLERSSPSTSKGLNGKDKDRLSAQSIMSGSSGKLPSDQRDSRTVPLPKNRCSDDLDLFGENEEEREYSQDNQPHQEEADEQQGGGGTRPSSSSDSSRSSSQSNSSSSSSSSSSADQDLLLVAAAVVLMKKRRGKMVAVEEEEKK